MYKDVHWSSGNGILDVDKYVSSEEWTAIGNDDWLGLADVVALCHKKHAPLVLSAPELYTVLKDALKEESENGHPKKKWQKRAERLLENIR